MNGDVVFSRPGVDVRPELEHVAPGPRVAAGAVAVVHKDLERGEVGPVAAIAVRVVGAHVAAAVELVFIGRAGAGYEVGAKEGSRCDVEIDRLEGGKGCECVGHFIMLMFEIWALTQPSVLIFASIGQKKLIASRLAGLQGRAKERGLSLVREVPSGLIGGAIGSSDPESVQCVCG